MVKLGWGLVNNCQNLRDYIKGSWEDDATIALREQTRMHHIATCESFDKSLMKDIVPHPIDITIKWLFPTPSFVKINLNEVVNPTNGKAMCER
ncbi:hypothetical protein CR513_32764, partial [Mucuna pruriens]